MVETNENVNINYFIFRVGYTMSNTDDEKNRLKIHEQIKQGTVDPSLDLEN